MLFSHQDHRTYLRQILAEKIQKNSRYSLRAFASHLDISPGMLSDVLKSKKLLSSEKALEISERLKHSADEELYFVSLVQLSNTKDPERRERILKRIHGITTQTNFQDLTIDQFHSVANWICVSALTLLGEFPRGLSAEKIASRFGVSVFEVEDALERWVRLDLVEKRSDGKYRKVIANHIRISSEAPASALRQFHAKMLEKTAEALETQTNAEKFVGTETISFDPRQLKEVEKIIEEAIEKILTKTASGEKKSEIYHLGFQFFRLTRKEK